MVAIAVLHAAGRPERQRRAVHFEDTDRRFYRFDGRNSSSYFQPPEGVLQVTEWQADEEQGDEEAGPEFI